MTANMQPPVAIGATTVVIKRRRSDPARRARLVHLLAVLLDKPDTPDDDRRQ